MSVLVGSGIATAYSLKAASGQDALVDWPVGSALHEPLARPRMLVFMHPECSCSRATLGELNVLLSNSPDLVDTDIVFSTPLSDVEQSSLWSAATRLSGVRVSADTGAQARLFKASTSGEVLLYSSKGLLLFQGGITASRGQRGDNRGRQVIERLIRQGDSTLHSRPVFGCPLFDGPEASHER